MTEYRFRNIKCNQRSNDPQGTHASSQDVGFSREGVVTVGLLCLTVMLTVAFFVWSSESFNSSISRYESSEAGTVMDVAYLHGLGTRTQIKTTTDLFLVAQAAHVHVGDMLVLQTNNYAQRLCIKTTERCWRVVNR
jgi:hypothetical protein